MDTRLFKRWEDDRVEIYQYFEFESFFSKNERKWM